MLNKLGKRKMTNVLVEGGSQLLGSLFDSKLVDEVHVFIAPKIAGGENATTAVAGLGVESIEEALSLDLPEIQNLDGDIYLSGRIQRNAG